MADDAGSILLLLPSLTDLGGGIELYLRQFLEAVVEARPRARLSAVLAREDGIRRPGLLSPALRARLAATGTARARRLPRIGEFVLHGALAALRHRPDLVVCGHVNLSPLAYLVARAARARLLSLTYGVEAWDVRQPLAARALRASDRVMTISRYTANRLVDAVGVERRRISIVNNAVDLERFRPGPPAPAVARKLGSLARPRLITVCRLDASESFKGVDVVLRTLARHPGLVGSYLVVGDGTDRPRLEALARELGVPALFYGRAPDAELADLYRACDLFIMPSRKEGFGYVFIEAMASGLPVVAGGVDGSVDAVGDGELGLLVDPLDESQIAAAIRAHLAGETPAHMRDPAWLHAEMTRRFSAARFARDVAAALLP